MRRPRRDERGAVAIVVALVTCFVLIPIAAFAVDIGVQRVARRDMQSVADVVALDLARQLDGRTYGDLKGSVQTMADKSLARNPSVPPGTEVGAVLGTLDEAAFDPADPTAYFTPVTLDAEVPTAVMVTARSAVRFSINAGTGGAVRTSIARSVPSACFKLGSFALALDSGNSALLNSLIGHALNVGILSYNGLATANVSMFGLATQLGAGTPQQLADTTVSLNDLYLAGATVLDNEGGDVAAVSLMNQLATADFGPLPPIRLGDLFALDSGDTAALGTSVNLLDLVAGSAFIANGSNALAIPNVTAGIPGIASVSSSLTLIQAPERGCGRPGVASVSTSQVDLALAVTLSDVNILGLAASSKVVMHLELAPADGLLTGVTCGSPEGIDVDVSSALTRVSLTLPIDLKLLGLTLVHVDGGVSTSDPGTTASVQIRIPPDSYDTPVRTGSGTVLPQLQLSDLSATVLGVLPLGLTVSSILSAVISDIVTPIVNPLIANINTQLIGPLSDLLGITIGGADVFAVPSPVCDAVALAG